MRASIFAFSSAAFASAFHRARPQSVMFSMRARWQWIGSSSTHFLPRVPSLLMWHALSMMCACQLPLWRRPFSSVSWYWSGFIARSRSLTVRDACKHTSAATPNFSAISFPKSSASVKRWERVSSRGSDISTSRASTASPRLWCCSTLFHSSDRSAVPPPGRITRQSSFSTPRLRL